MIINSSFDIYKDLYGYELYKETLYSSTTYCKDAPIDFKKLKEATEKVQKILEGVQQAQKKLLFDCVRYSPYVPEEVGFIIKDWNMRTDEIEKYLIVNPLYKKGDRSRSLSIDGELDWDLMEKKEVNFYIFPDPPKVNYLSTFKKLL